MQMPRKIAFIHAPQVYYEQNFGTRFAPIWAYTLASYMDRNQWDARVHDLTVCGMDDVGDAEIFAFSGINQDFESIVAAQRELKRRYPRATFILGGPITWSYEKNGNLDQLMFFDHLFILDGEETFPAFLRNWAAGAKPKTKIIRAPQRYPMAQMKGLSFDLMRDTAKNYYGGVVEVSRGCPFLCEFCDIRVLPQNNESHTKDVALIVAELEEYRKIGIKQIQLACDNFIGNLGWANQCVDAIDEWVKKTGAEVALHTWVTVNLASQPALMTKMRKAGFTSVFIGVESFNRNSVLETSKLQNRNENLSLPEALAMIHQHGFIIAPGLIFGFDSDSTDMFDQTLAGVLESGMIGGDPTFLLALPGTPLFQRMKSSGRLVTAEENKGLKLDKSRISKIESNIRYLQPKDFLIQGFMYFVKRFTAGSYNYRRFKRHVDLTMTHAHEIARHSTGYGNLGKFLSYQTSSFKNFTRFVMRILLIIQPANLFYVIKAYGLVIKHSRAYPGIKNHFMFWLFAWSNLMLKYRGMKQEDFNLHSIPENYDLDQVWKYERHEEPELVGGRNTDGVKVGLQLKSTQSAIKRLREDYSSHAQLRERFNKHIKKFKEAA